MSIKKCLLYGAACGILSSLAAHLISTQLHLSAKASDPSLFTVVPGQSSSSDLSQFSSSRFQLSCNGELVSHNRAAFENRLKIYRHEFSCIFTDPSSGLEVMVKGELVSYFAQGFNDSTSTYDLISEKGKPILVTSELVEKATRFGKSQISACSVGSNFKLVLTIQNIHNFPKHAKISIWSA